MATIAVILNQIKCIKTSRGLGDDDIYIVTELRDPKNAAHPLLARTLSHIGNMGANDTKTVRENPNLTIAGDRNNYLVWLPNAPAIDSLECYMLVLKAGPLTSYKTGPTDPADTNSEAQKAEADVADSLAKELQAQQKQLQDELNALESALPGATGPKLEKLQANIRVIQAKLKRISDALARLNASIAAGGEIIQLIIDVVSLVLTLKGSWGSTVALGQDVWDVDIPPVNGIHPVTGGPHKFDCTDNDCVYNVAYQIGIAGY